MIAPTPVGGSAMTDARTAQLTIAELAARAGVTPRTIRYYVAEGLLPPPGGRGQRPPVCPADPDAPLDSVRRRHSPAPGGELHSRDAAAPALSAAIARVLRGRGASVGGQTSRAEYTGAAPPDRPQ